MVGNSAVMLSIVVILSGLMWSHHPSDGVRAQPVRRSGVSEWKLGMCNVQRECY